MTPKTQIQTIALDHKEKRALESLASKICYPDEGNYDAYVAACRAAVLAALSPATLTAIRALRRPGAAAGPVVITNLPFDASVTHGLIDPEVALAGKPNDMSEAILTGIVSLLGEPYAILFEGKGLISHLSPKRSHLNIDTGLGARRELSAHIENAAARLLADDRAPDGLALIGVSKERDASPGTLVADGRLALARLSPVEQAILADPTRFEARFPNRWRDHGFTQAIATAIVRPLGEGVEFVAALYGDLTIALDAEAQAALDAFRNALAAVEIDLHVEPGQLALLDNHVILHGRRAFEPAFDEDGRPYRLLQRLFWISSLARFDGWTRVRGRLVGPIA